MAGELKLRSAQPMRVIIFMFELVRKGLHAISSFWGSGGLVSGLRLPIDKKKEKILQPYHISSEGIEKA